jgi:hypothetical protein
LIASAGLAPAAIRPKSVLRGFLWEAPDVFEVGFIVNLMFAKPLPFPILDFNSISKKYTRKITFTPNKLRTQGSQDKLGRITLQSRFLSAFAIA